MRVRLDHFLVGTELELTRSQIKRLIDEGCVLVNGKPAKTSTKLRPGDEAVVTQPPPVEARAVPQGIPLSILYEDAHLIVVDKAPGMVVHPAPGHPDGTLVNALLGHCTDLSGIGGELRPGIVHRIDKDTSGILVVSKDDAAHHGLADGFKNKTHHRQYLAIAFPGPKAGAGKMDTLHGRHPVHRKRFSSKVSCGKTAVTHYTVVKRFVEPVALLQLRLETGRTHQIRVHCADSGFPLLADPVYSRVPKSEPLRSLAQGLGRQALHAAELGFEHPITGEAMLFRSPLPADIQAVLDALRPVA
ncbi:MAG: RluA family pseudouridine synthase [Myxococcales bacterium]|nr:RluA family pseudouridine synthase [Myxococcales bacterium]